MRGTIDKPIVTTIERDDGARIIRDMTGAEVDLTAAEAACEAHEMVVLTFKRPSDAERERREWLEEKSRIEGHYMPIGIRNDPDEQVELILERPEGWEIDRVESTLGRMVDALRSLLAAHELLRT